MHWKVESLPWWSGKSPSCHQEELNLNPDFATLWICESYTNTLACYSNDFFVSTRMWPPALSLDLYLWFFLASGQWNTIYNRNSALTLQNLLSGNVSILSPLDIWDSINGHAQNQHGTEDVWGHSGKTSALNNCNQHGDLSKDQHKSTPTVYTPNCQPRNLRASEVTVILSHWRLG